MSAISMLKKPSAVLSIYAIDAPGWFSRKLKCKARMSHLSISEPKFSLEVNWVFSGSLQSIINYFTCKPFPIL